MGEYGVIVALVASTLVVAVAGVLHLWRSLERSPGVGSLEGTLPSLLPLKENAPAERDEREVLVLANARGEHVIEVTPFDHDERTLSDASVVDGTRRDMLARMGAMLSVAPSMAVAAAAHGRRLMEVSVNGDLVRAANGEGFRGFVMGAKGIKEHARFFDVGQIGKLANAAAVWQIASILVAQKHLADINLKLDAIRKLAAEAVAFQRNARSSRIEGAADYLEQVRRVLLTGDFDPSMRDELESIERDMLGFQRHIFQDFEQEYAEVVEHTEGVGTEHLHRDIRAKIERLGELKDEYRRCMAVRSMGCYLTSLYPGSAGRARVGRDAILCDLATFSDLMPLAHAKVSGQIEAMSAFFNFQSTLDDRKANLRSLLEEKSLVLIPDDGMEREFARLARPEQQARYVLEYDRDELVSVHELEA